MEHRWCRYSKWHGEDYPRPAADVEGAQAQIFAPPAQFGLCIRTVRQTGIAIMMFPGTN